MEDDETLSFTMIVALAILLKISPEDFSKKLVELKASKEFREYVEKLSIEMIRAKFKMIEKE